MTKPLFSAFHEAGPPLLFIPGRYEAQQLHADFVPGSFSDYCVKPVAGDIHYKRGGRTHSKKIGEIGQAFRYYSFLEKKGECPTLFLHGVDYVNEALRDTALRMAPDQRWRFSNVSAAISHPGSSIGFHGDMFEVVIVQVEGTREWKLWRKENMPPLYLRELQKGHLPPGPGIDVPPDAVISLAPGDVMFIPAYWGHEGITSPEKTSFSLSFSWVIFTPYIFLSGLIEQLSPGDRQKLEADSRFLDVYEPAEYDRAALQEYLEFLLKDCGIPFEKETVGQSIVRSLKSLIAPQ